MTEAPGSTARTGVSLGVVWLIGGLGTALGTLAIVIAVIIFYGPHATANMPHIEQQQQQEYQKVLSSVCAQQRAQGDDPSEMEDCPSVK